RVRESLDHIILQVRNLLCAFGAQIEKYAGVPSIAFTHLQPAEPTTVGYRLAQYAQDILIGFEQLASVRAQLRGKGIKGAVGTSASYRELLADGASSVAELETLVMRRLDLEAFPVATQVYARKQDWLVLNALAGLAQS